MTQANDFNFWITQSENQSILQKKQSETFLVILIDMMSIGISNEMNEMHTATRSSFIFIMVTWSRDLYMTASVFQLLISCDA